jgi:hypothetical protein
VRNAAPPSIPAPPSPPPSAAGRCSAGCQEAAANSFEDPRGPGASIHSSSPTLQLLLSAAVSRGSHHPGGPAPPLAPPSGASLMPCLAVALAACPAALQLLLVHQRSRLATC